MSVADSLAGVTVELGFGVDAVGGDFFVLDDPVKGLLDDGAGLYNTVYELAPATVFVDVTEHVRSITTDRGRERELDEYATGKATVVFKDNDRTFDPAYSGSPYFGEIVPMKRIAVIKSGAPLFTGWVDDWSVTYEPGDSLSWVTAECVDAFAILANQELREIAPNLSGELSGERIVTVLDRPEINFPAARSIDDGNSTLGDTTLGANALAYLQACARAEAGYLFVDAAGVLTFRNRLATLNVPADVTFSDDRTAGIPYRNVSQRSAADLLYTRVTATSETTDNEVEAEADAADTDDYLIRTLALGTLFTIDDDETQGIVDYYLERFKAPELRFQTAEVNVAALDAGQVAAVATLELTDVVSVERSPLGIGDTISRLSLVDGISHRIGHGSWVVELSFSNADTRSFLMLDDAVFGVLDANRLAF
jgi:hypothetical protein